MKRLIFSIIFCPFLCCSSSFANQIDDMIQEMKSPSQIAYPLYPQDFNPVLPITSTTNQMITPPQQAVIPTVVFMTFITAAVFAFPVNEPVQEPKRRRKAPFTQYKSHQDFTVKNTYRHQGKRYHATHKYSNSRR